MSKPCRCVSYNNPQPDQVDPEVILYPVNHGPAFPTKSVCVDACIAPVIEALWRKGIWTFGCCCGHNQPGERSVIVDRDDRAAAVGVIRGMRDDAKVLAWELV